MSCQLVRLFLVDDKEEVVNELSVEADEVRVISEMSESEESCLVNFKQREIGTLKSVRVFGSIVDITNQVNSARKGN